MTHSLRSPLSALFFVLLGALFCLLIALHTGIDLCTTTGCTLYAETTIGGVSLWWYGLFAFVFLAALLLSRKNRLSYHVARLALFLDLCLLILMAATAPCINCLLVGLLFALTFYRVRRWVLARSRPTFSKLLLVWGLFFLINTWTVAKQEMGTWALLGNEKTATVHLYFSPSCSHCRDALALFAGSVDTAFYPISESPKDLARILAMKTLLAKDVPIDQAAEASQDAQELQGFAAYSPELLSLQLKLLLNKAYVLSQGSPGVPYVAFRGVPRLPKRASQNTSTPLQTLDHTTDFLPKELAPTSNQCVKADCE
ncbi:MAG: hypothetical protein IJS54_01570 [Desulfovibrio sp.]|nr:hypothetical protein [Desulfovibrio sp.]